ncbi:MAG: hypothetical protein FGM15_13370 [Chthoniobacterales bacterium]|nr:hypothetical protein [Chthoniobacterales bacterium]
MSSFHDDQQRIRRLRRQRKWRAVLRRWWVVLLGGIIGGALALYPDARPKALFTATATVGAGAAGAGGSPEAEAKLADSAREGAKLLNSNAAAVRVLQETALLQDPDFLAGLSGQNAETGEVDKTAASRRLQGAVFASARGADGLIDIEAQTESPDLCVKIANAYAEQFPRIMEDKAGQSASTATEILALEKSRLETKLQMAGKALQSFINRQGGKVDDAMLAEAQSKIDGAKLAVSDAEGDLLRLDADLAKVPACNGDVAKLLQLSSVRADPQVAALVEETGQQADAAAEQQDRLSAPVLEAVARLEVRRAEAEQRLEKAKAAMAAAVDRHLDLSASSVEYTTLEANAKAAKTRYDAFLDKVTASPGKKGGPESARIVERAREATRMHSSRSWRAVWGVVAGMSVGLALVLGLVFSRRGPQDYDYDLGNA